MTIPVLAFQFWYLPAGLLWAFLGLLAFWVWRRSRSSGHLVMLIGAAWIAQYYVLATFGVCLLGASNYDVAALLGFVVFTVGFYLTVKPLVAEDLAALRRRIGMKLANKPGVAPTLPYAPPSASGTPTSAPAAAPYIPPPPPPPAPPDELTLR